MFFLISKIGGTVLPNMTGPVPGCYSPGKRPFLLDEKIFFQKKTNSLRLKTINFYFCKKSLKFSS